MKIYRFTHLGATMDTLDPVPVRSPGYPGTPQAPLKGALTVPKTSPQMKSEGTFIDTS